MANPLCWLSIASKDHTKQAEFYKTAFGWKIKKGPPHMGNFFADTGVKDVGADISPVQPGEQPKHMFSVAVKNIDAHIEKLKGLGSTVLMPKRSLGEGMGELAVVSDAEGNPVGLWQAPRAAKKKAVAKQPPTPAKKPMKGE